MNGHRASDIAGAWLTALCTWPWTAGTTTNYRTRCTTDIGCRFLTVSWGSWRAGGHGGLEPPWPLQRAIGVEWPLLELQLSLASEGDEWRVLAAAIPGLQKLTDSNQPSLDLGHERVNCSMWLMAEVYSFANLPGQPTWQPRDAKSMPTGSRLRVSKRAVRVSSSAVSAVH